MRVGSVSVKETGHLQTGSDCESASRLSRAKVEVDQLSNAGMSVD
jgi:hypothetical protein